MWHVGVASSRASIWAAVAWLVVLPVLAAHTTHLLMLGVTWTKTTHLVEVVATEAVVRATVVLVWASEGPWAVAAVVIHAGWAHVLHAPMVSPALLPLTPSITVVVVGTKAHAHACNRWYTLHAEVRLVGGIRRYVRNLYMPRASAAIDDLVSNIFREHGHEIVKHAALR